MTLLCQKLSLDPKTTTHNQFVTAFTDLQKQSLEDQKYMQEQFMLSSVPKTPKERKRKSFDQAIEDSDHLPEGMYREL